MTARQIQYMELCKSGYGLREIADITHKSMGNIFSSLLKAVDKPCRASGKCAACPLAAECTANYKRVMGLRRKIMDDSPKRGGRYSY